jgi:hypothetical protein
MLALALTIVVSAAETRSAPTKLALIGFSGADLSAELRSSFAETFALRLTEAGMRVTTPKDVAGILGVERQKQLLGCAEESTACMAELAGALAVDGVITGDVSRIGKVLQLTIKVVAPSDGRVLFTHIERLPDEEAVLQSLDAAARAAAERLAGPSAKRSLRSLPLVTAAVGLVAAGAGAALWGIAVGQFERLNDPIQWGALTPAEAQSIRTGGPTLQGAGIALVAVGTAALVAAIIWYFVGASP